MAPLSLRLVGGSSHNEGRLEVFYGGMWGTVCNNKFDWRSAKVACNHLGYSGGDTKRHIQTTFGTGTGRIWLDKVQCSGSEQLLDHCQHRGWGITDCDHNKDIGVQCTGNGKLSEHLNSSQMVSINATLTHEIFL